MVIQVETILTKIIRYRRGFRYVRFWPGGKRTAIVQENQQKFFNRNIAFTYLKKHYLFIALLAIENQQERNLGHLIYVFAKVNYFLVAGKFVFYKLRRV
jgi:hypothetical protein